MNSEPKPPGHLSRQAKALWRKIAAESDVDAAGAVLLDTLCEAWDRMHQARELIASQGCIVREKTAAGNEKLRPHPAIAQEHQAAQTMMKAWRLLGFDQMPPA
jgi:P27 family predicted phage terminase small subunit